MNAVDRIICKVDQTGPVAYAADSLRADSILAYRPDNGSEPFYVSLEQYHAAKPASDKVTRDVARKWEQVWGNPTLVMQRLPRVLRQQPSFKLSQALQEQRKTQGQDTTQPAQAPTLTLVQNPEEAKKGFAMTQHASGMWMITRDGKRLAFAADEDTGISVLMDLSGVNAKRH